MPIYPAGAARRAAVSAWGAARHASGRLEGGPRGSSRTARGPAGAERKPPRLSRGPGRRLARLSQPQPSCLSPAALHGAIGLSLSFLAARLAYTVRLLRPPLPHRRSLALTASSARLGPVSLGPPLPCRAPG